MKNFTKEQMDQWMKQARELIDKMADGVCERDLMADLYVKNLEEKSLRQGYVMADAMLESVQDFADLYAGAQDNLDGCIEQFQDTVEEHMTLAERCNYWRDFCLVLDAVMASAEEESIVEPQILCGDYLEEITEEEATAELAQTLRQKSKEMLRDSGFAVAGIAKLEERLEEMENAEETVNFLLGIGAKEVEYRGVLTMLAYVKIKNGEFEEIPVDMTVEQVAAMVCAGAEQIRILEAVAEGSLAEDVAVLLLQILGIVVLMKLALVVGTVGIPLVAGLFGAVLVIPACIMMVAGILHLFAKAEELWSADSQVIVKTVFAGLRQVKKGAEYVAEHVKKYWKELTQMKKGTRERVRVNIVKA